MKPPLGLNQTGEMESNSSARSLALGFEPLGAALTWKAMRMIYLLPDNEGGNLPPELCVS